MPMFAWQKYHSNSSPTLFVKMRIGYYLHIVLRENKPVRLLVYPSTQTYKLYQLQTD